MPGRAPAGSAPAQHSRSGCSGFLRIWGPSPPMDPPGQGALPTQGAPQGLMVRPDNLFGKQQLTSWRAGTKTPEGADEAGGLVNTLHSTRAEFSPPLCTIKFCCLTLTLRVPIQSPVTILEETAVEVSPPSTTSDRPEGLIFPGLPFQGQFNLDQHPTHTRGRKTSLSWVTEEHSTAL